MADPILGPAWPALLAPGLRIVCDVNGPGTVVVIDREDDPWVVFDRCFNEVKLAEAPLSIDYAHPATRDAVCRALEARTGRRLNRAFIDAQPGRLRDEAAAVWGGK